MEFSPGIYKRNNSFLKYSGIVIDYENWKFIKEKTKLEKLYFIKSHKRLKYWSIVTSLKLKNDSGQFFYTVIETLSVSFHQSSSPCSVIKKEYRGISLKTKS